MNGDSQGGVRSELAVLPRISSVELKQETPQFVQLGEVKEMRTEPDIQFHQPRCQQREQTKIFKLENTGEKTEVQIVIRAAYRQILSAILNPISTEYTPKTLLQARMVRLR